MESIPIVSDGQILANQSFRLPARETDNVNMADPETGTGTQIYCCAIPVFLL